MHSQVVIQPGVRHCVFLLGLVREGHETGSAIYGEWSGGIICIQDASEANHRLDRYYDQIMKSVREYPKRHH